MKKNHVDPEAVTDVIHIIKGNFVDLTIYRGKEHTFLGTTITLIEYKIIEIEMKDQLEESIGMFSDELLDTEPSIEAKYPLLVNKGALPLD